VNEVKDQIAEMRATIAAEALHAKEEVKFELMHEKSPQVATLKDFLAQQVLTIAALLSSFFVENVLHKCTREYMPTRMVKLTGRPKIEFTDRHKIAHSCMSRNILTRSLTHCYLCMLFRVLVNPFT
jgi:hypothetical protein